mgnify:CR=1 FL=1
MPRFEGIETVTFSYCVLGFARSEEMPRFEGIETLNRESISKT